MAVSNIMGQIEATRKHEDFNLVFTNHGMEDEIYPLKGDSKAQDKRSKIYLLYNMQNTYKGVVFSTYKRHSSAI
jgi:hypothetical protein